MPFYSVIIPVFNRAGLVGATLDSVVAQSCGDWELLVVDDGSTDGTLAILEFYREKLGARMQILQQQHAGPGAARNQAIAVATGRYLAFLDSDDLWFSWTLEFYRRTLEEHDFPAFMAGEPLVFDSQEQWSAALYKSHADLDATIEAGRANRRVRRLLGRRTADRLAQRFVVRDAARRPCGQSVLPAPN